MHALLAFLFAQHRGTVSCVYDVRNAHKQFFWVTYFRIILLTVCVSNKFPLLIVLKRCKVSGCKPQKTVYHIKGHGGSKLLLQKQRGHQMYSATSTQWNINNIFISLNNFAAKLHLYFGQIEKILLHTVHLNELRLTVIGIGCFSLAYCSAVKFPSDCLVSSSHIIFSIKCEADVNVSPAGLWVKTVIQRKHLRNN